MIGALKVCSVPQDLGDSVTRELAEMLPHELLPPPQVVRERCGSAEVPRIHRDKVLVHAHGLKPQDCPLSFTRHEGVCDPRSLETAVSGAHCTDLDLRRRLMKGGMRVRSFLGIIQARLSLWDP